MNSYLAGDRGIIFTQVKRKIHPTVSVTGVRWGRRGKTSAEGMGKRVSGLMVTISRPRGCEESSGGHGGTGASLHGGQEEVEI